MVVSKLPSSVWRTPVFHHDPASHQQLEMYHWVLADLEMANTSSLTRRLLSAVLSPVPKPPTTSLPSHWPSLWLATQGRTP